VNLIDYAVHWFGTAANWSGPDGIPARLLQHLSYSGLALLIAAAIGIPLGLVLGHTGRGAFAVINLANAARAVPTLGLLTLVVVAVSIGVLPVLVALIALAVPPILVNTYEGIRTVDPELTDAAHGMGMTGPQVLLRVRFPVALPLVFLGLRLAAIQIVSTATIAAYVGLGGLGRFIIDGIERQDYASTVGGAVLAVLLALLAEVVFVVAARLLVSRGVRARA
jgi:osmoprotectant transport system permease protein